MWSSCTVTIHCRHARRASFDNVRTLAPQVFFALAEQVLDVPDHFRIAILTPARLMLLA